MVGYFFVPCTTIAMSGRTTSSSEWVTTIFSTRFEKVKTPQFKRLDSSRANHSLGDIAVFEYQDQTQVIIFLGEWDVSGYTELLVTDTSWYPIDVNSKLGASCHFTSVTLKNTVYRFGGHYAGTRRNQVWYFTMVDSVVGHWEQMHSMRYQKAGFTSLTFNQRW